MGGGWGAVGREEPGLESAAAAALIAPEGPEENPDRPGASGLLCVGPSGPGSAARLSAEP